MVRILAVALLLLCVNFTEACAMRDPWCAPMSVMLKFPDQQAREALKIELRSPALTCSMYDQDEAIRLYRQPEMHIDFYDKAINVPNSCLMWFSFKLSDLTASIGDAGMVIKILGKYLDTRMLLLIYVIHDGL